jgi:diadenosine tetraphosphate (Ap4A) HIT family hydrolase
MKGCMFCEQQVKGDPANVIIQNDYAVATMADDLREGHFVINIKNHRESVSELTPEEYNGFFEIVVKVSKAVEKKYNIKKVYMVTIADGVPHLHFHMIPKHPNLPSLGVYVLEGIRKAEGKRNPTPEHQVALAKEIRGMIEGK